MKNSAILLTLTHSAFFNSLTMVELSLLAEHSHIDRIEKYDKLYESRSRKEYVYIVLRGALKLESQTDSGKVIIKDVAYKNDIFGENIFVENQYRDEYAEAIQDSSILCMDIDTFKTLAFENIQFGNELTQIFLKKLLKLEDRIEIFREGKAKSRIINFIKKLAESRAVIDKKLGHILDHGLSHLDIARMTDTSRQTAARVMNELKRDGMITFPDRRPRTINVDKLLSN